MAKHLSRPVNMADTLILEGLVTTLAGDGAVNVSPMGPRVDRAVTCLQLRPYQSSRTYQNLKRHGEGVFHVTDDVELIAHCAVGDAPSQIAGSPAAAVAGWILGDACRWYAFRVQRLDDSAPRTTIECEIVDQGRVRDFLGFNRAKHAVVEAAILATRVDWLEPEPLRREIRDLAVWVEKTGGEQERRAFGFLQQYVTQRLQTR